MNLEKLYGKNCEHSFYENRIKDVENTFFKNEGYKPQNVFSSPGRAEILGNHTDHNNGLVMVATISCDIIAVTAKTDTNTIKVCSLGYPAVVVDLNDLAVNESEYGTSNALVRGVAKGIIDRGYNIGGFTCYTSSNIFKGAGVSSSAAFEVLICEIFNHYYLNGALNEVDRAVISQFSENVYFNKPCGILDQSGISIGSLIKLDFNNPKNPIITKLNPPKGYTLVITNTGGDHAKLTPHYKDIKAEMTLIANHFNKTVLREIDYDDFLNEMPILKDKYPSRAILRAMHFFKENERVIKAETALNNNDVLSFLTEVNNSGLSSLTLLQNCFVPGETNQPVVLGIELSRAIIKDGAVRVHGGGFAGSILAVVNDKEVDGYVLKMQEVFGSKNVFKASVREVGTTIIK